MPADRVAAELDPDTRVANLAEYLDRIDSTVQYSWLLEIARTFHRFPHDRITPRNIGELLERADHRQDGEAWDREVWKASRLEAVFLTNEFDDPLEGWDTAAYVPCLRTDDLVLKLHEAATIERLRAASDVDVQDYAEPAPGDRAGVRAVLSARREGLRDQPAARLRPAPSVAATSGHADPQGHPRAWTSGPTSRRRSAAPSSGCWPSSAPSSGSRST